MNTSRILSTGFGLFLILTLLSAGCGTLGKAEPAKRAETASGVSITRQDAQTRLSAASDNLLAVVTGAARDIELQTDSLRIKRFTLVVRVRFLQECHRILQLEDPRLGALDLLTLGHQTLHYFETGDGRTILGELADLAVPPIERQVRLLDESVAFFVSREVYEAGMQEIRSFAEASPITGETFARPSRPMEMLGKGKSGVLTTLLSVPFKPFEFGDGIGEAAAAIDRFSAQTEKFTDVMASMPLQVQWNMQYLLYALEDNRTVDAALSEFKAATEALQLAAKAADNLPAKVGAETRKTIERIENSQEEIRATLGEMRQVAVDAKATIVSVTEASASISEASASISDASVNLSATAEAWLPTAEAFDKLINPPEDPDEPVDEDPFKMPQVTEAAIALTGSAKELQTLVADLRGLLDSDEIGGTLTRVDDTAKSAVDHTAERAVDLTDHVTWRAIQLVLVIFGVAFVYRLVTWKIPRRAREKRSTKEGSSA